MVLCWIIIRIESNMCCWQMCDWLLTTDHFEWTGSEKLNCRSRRCLKTLKQLLFRIQWKSKLVWNQFTKVFQSKQILPNLVGVKLLQIVQLNFVHFNIISHYILHETLYFFIFMRTWLTKAFLTIISIDMFRAGFP